MVANVTGELLARWLAVIPWRLRNALFWTKAGFGNWARPKQRQAFQFDTSETRGLMVRNVADD
jgi:hypothetical protein